MLNFIGLSSAKFLSLFSPKSMDSSKALPMEDAVDCEEISDSFLCCVCLELLYKPIVLPCGHISCFWCVHRSMSNRSESHCPICRNQYAHFPTICQMLHFLLLKMYPIAYRNRGKQILDEENKMGCFSPQIDSHACESHTNGEYDHLGDSAHLSTVGSEFKPSEGELGKSSGQLEAHDTGTTVTKQASDRNFNRMKCFAGKESKVSVADLLCSACKQLLFRPIVLNCGHVYCEACIINAAGEMLRCQVCQHLHPCGLPKVCLVLDYFLEENFSQEYSLRKDAVQLKQVVLNYESKSIRSIEAGKQDVDSSPVASQDHMPCSIDSRSNIHIGVGCDSCGMYPIIGDRYRCRDCVEEIGFDLCTDCYNTESKLPGRFNQQHTPEHKFELIKPDIIRNIMVRLVTGQLDHGSTAIFIAGDASENWENGAAVINIDDSEESSSSGSPARVNQADSMEGQTDSNSSN